MTTIRIGRVYSGYHVTFRGGDFSPEKESARRAGDDYEQEQVDEGSAGPHKVNCGDKI
jgi:hypothetical protein